MNHALFYLWATLLKRRGMHFCRSLRRPTTLVGFVAVLAMLGFLFCFRHHEFMGKLVKRENLVGCGMVMLFGSLFKGFLQRGLVFEPPDIDFVFTSPFTQRQIVFYRLFSSYLFAVIQGVVFLGLFAPHFAHPVFAALCLILFQIACFHLSTAAAIFAGTLSDAAHHRIRWMMLGVFFLLAALYLRLDYGFKLVPSWASSPLMQLLFYPAVILPDAAATPALHRFASQFAGNTADSADTLWQPLITLVSFGMLVLASLWLMLKVKANVFEASITTTTSVAEKRLRLKQGRGVTATADRPLRSAALPTLPLFRGVGAIIWKNLIVARRSRRELMLAGAFTLVYSGFFVGLLWIYHTAIKKSPGPVPLQEVMAFHIGIAIFLGALGLFLQRMFPFDFRRDGQYLVSFRTLPVSPLGLALAEVTVPTIFCLGSQAIGIGALMIFGVFPWTTAVFILLAYPAIALGLNAVWNVHYLLAAARRVGGKAEAASTVGTLMIVALSFLVFFPAGWTAMHIGQYFTDKPGYPLATASSVSIQYLIDILLVLLLAKLFQRFEVTRDAQ